ncbi:MAG: DUF2231 domain-containing protein [Armatimonadota bacterium]|nr:DUF2231 domain-containing protein [Armatimonadota bacterium]
MPFLYHPLVVHFPIALWLTSFLFDLLHAWRRDRTLAVASAYLVGLGLLGAGVSIVAGFLDYRPLVAEGVGQAFIDRHRVHSLLAYTATGLYLALFVARWRWHQMPRALSLAAAAAGAVLIGLTGWWGGEVRRIM